MPHKYEIGNDVTFLRDGVSYFSRLDTLLSDVRDHANGDGWVHIRMWMCDETTVIDLSGGTTFRERIKQVAERGNEVRILLWQPSANAITYAGFGSLDSLHKRVKTNLESDDPHTKVQLLENTAGFLHMGSEHAKTVITCNGDSVTVLVGGLNIQTDYIDDKPHNTRPSRWHDAAVQIKGPQTMDVERDFHAGWALSPAPIPSVKGPLNQQSTGSWTEVYIASRTLDPPSVHDELLERFGHAKELVYIENYSIHCPDLIDTLARRISATHLYRSPLKVHLLVNDAADPIYGWLHYVTYCVLSHASCRSFTFNSGTGQQTVQRSGATVWEFDRRGTWYEDSVLRWSHQGSLQPANEVSIKHITGFVGDVPLHRLVAVTPAGGTVPVFVHCKVAFIDDTYASVGSANFCPRSMNEDIELNAFIQDKLVVEPMRQQLWSEYTPVAPTQLGPDDFVAKVVRPLGGPGLYVVPIDFHEWPKSEPPNQITNAVLKRYVPPSCPGVITGGLNIAAAHLYSAALW
jgi:phosphatidylserine/phosphatidylglycerophosphate/cardiolipin synthase-like enzyme